MSTAQAEYQAKAMEICDLYLRNARAKLGVAENPPKPAEEVPPVPLPTASQPSSGPAPAAAVAAGASRLAKAAVVGALGLGTLGAGAGLWALSRPTTTVIQQPADPQSQSVLPYLDENGFNSPEVRK